jgi:predicted nucleic acid-binding Zn ribbon protein
MSSYRYSKKIIFMKSQTNHCCFSCGADISHKRSDAKYCSGRCRMRCRRRQQKLEIIGKLAETFNALPHHDAQFTGNGFYLVGTDATSGKTRK